MHAPRAIFPARFTAIALLAVCTGCPPSGQSKPEKPAIGTTTQSFDKVAELDTDAKEISNSIGMELVRIEPGSFTMGWNEEMKKNYAPDISTFGGDEQKVTISRPFYYGQIRGHPGPCGSKSWGKTLAATNWTTS